MIFPTSIARAVPLKRKHPILMKHRHRWAFRAFPGGSWFEICVLGAHPATFAKKNKEIPTKKRSETNEKFVHTHTFL